MNSVRRWIAWHGMGMIIFATLGASPTVAFELADVAARAQALAAAPYQVPKGQVPDWLLKINYDQLRDIRFRPDRALWRDRRSKFQVQFFHPGLYFNRTVAVNVVEDGQARPVEFSTKQFDYGKNDFVGKIPSQLGYAGFRIHYPLKRPNYSDELVVFVGASYFRALGRDQVYGLSARGLAVDTVESRGEEFPYFTEFWLVTPAPDADTMTLYALLDSPSVTGAYRFDLQPGEQTVIEVDSRVFPRQSGRKIGIAPLTSMFFHGENTRRFFDDFRPEVHDSDGLLLHFDTGEWMWRPLDNPTSLRVSGFQMRDPKGFGLIQRDRDFDHHQDIETRAEMRPSVWIEPRARWGAGRIDLVELPTDTDIHDNIVSFWVPEEPATPDKAMQFAYTIHWYGADSKRPPGGRVTATRRDAGTGTDSQRFVLDFVGDSLNAIPADRPPRAVVTVGGGPDSGVVFDEHLVKNPATNGWRLTFQLRPKTKQPIELRAFLTQGPDVLTETWSYAVVQ